MRHSRFNTYHMAVGAEIELVGDEMGFDRETL